MKIDTFAKRLSKALEMRGISAADLSRTLGINEAVISQYKNGKYEPRQNRLDEFAQVLNVNESWLMGYDVPMERTTSSSPSAFQGLPDNILPIRTQKVPLLGEIACGQPIFASEEYGEFVLTSGDIKADFCLKAKGDSMTGARIYDGDVVFIRQQEEVENGQIAAVLIGDEATLKRVYYYPDKGKLILNPENPAFEPLVYMGEELNSVRILGRAVAFQSMVR